MGKYFQAICKYIILLVLFISISFKTLQFSLENKEPLPSSTAQAGSSLGFSAVVYKDDFRPTAPGSSPGVGHHSFQQGRRNMEVVAAWGDQALQHITAKYKLKPLN